MIPPVRIVPIWWLGAAFAAGLAVTGLPLAGVLAFQRGKTDALEARAAAAEKAATLATTQAGQAQGANNAFASADRRVEAACTAVRTDVAAAREAAQRAEVAARDSMAASRSTASRILATKPSSADLCVSARDLFDALRAEERQP